MTNVSNIKRSRRANLIEYYVRIYFVKLLQMP